MIQDKKNLRPCTRAHLNAFEFLSRVAKKPCNLNVTALEKRVGEASTAGKKFFFALLHVLREWQGEMGGGKRK